MMTVATMASLLLPPTRTTAILPLIDLALALTLALPWTRIGLQGGGHAMMRLICCHHGHCCWRHLCLCSWNDGAKDDGRGARQGHHANIRSREEVGHHEPIGMAQQKKKKKKKKKKKSTTVTAMSPPLRLQTATPMLHLLQPLRKQRQQRVQYGGSGVSSSSSSRAVAAAAHYFELPCSVKR